MAHTHYTGTGMMHSFRGLLADGGQDKIRIQGSVGSIAWRITKFQILPEKPGDVAQESLGQVWREKVTTVPTSSATINFNNEELLAAAVGMYGGISGNTIPFLESIIFDNALFVRNIYVTHTDNENAESLNYYIELEEVKVSAAGMAQLAIAAARRLA